MMLHMEQLFPMFVSPTQLYLICIGSLTILLNFSARDLLSKELHGHFSSVPFALCGICHIRHPEQFSSSDFRQTRDHNHCPDLPYACLCSHIYPPALSSLGDYVRPGWIGERISQRGMECMDRKHGELA